MATPYVPLNDSEKYFHITSMTENGVPISGVLASGEAVYYDKAQNPRTRTFIGPFSSFTVIAGASPLYSVDSTNSGTPVIQPTGLYHQLYLSNGIDSKDYSINDFSTFKPYIHYMPNNSTINAEIINPNGLAFLVDTSVFLNLAVVAYNSQPK